MRLSSISSDFFVSIVLTVASEQAFGLEWGGAGSSEQVFALLGAPNNGHGYH